MQLKAIGQKIKGLLFNPTETLQELREEDLSDAFLYFLVLLLFSSVMTAIVSGGSMAALRQLTTSLGYQIPLASLSALGGGLIFVATFFTMLFFTFIGGLWLHLWVYLLGGRRGISETLKAVFYGMTPTMLLSWIPFIGFLAGLWGLVLQILGVKELQQLSTGKSVLAIFLAILVPALVFGFLAFSVIMAGTAALSGLAGP